MYRKNSEYFLDEGLRNSIGIKKRLQKNCRSRAIRIYFGSYQQQLKPDLIDSWILIIISHDAAAVGTLKFGDGGKRDYFKSRPSSVKSILRKIEPNEEI